MNNRIKQLAEQSGFGEQWFEEHPTGACLPKPLMMREYTEALIKESAFAIQCFVDQRIPASEYPQLLLEYFSFEPMKEFWNDE